MNESVIKGILFVDSSMCCFDMCITYTISILYACLYVYIMIEYGVIDALID
jgi:hypothetical protein